MRRSQSPHSTASKGAPSAIAAAATLMSCPPNATETCNELTRSFSEPAVTITPQPMAKLPASMARLACFSDIVGPSLAVSGIRTAAGHCPPRAQRSTFSASGLTRWVGVLWMKLTTLSNAAPKYSS